MKKLFILLITAILFCGCTLSETNLSDGDIQTALDILYKEINNMNLNHTTPMQFIFIKGYLENKNYKNNYECGILDMSDVQGTKHIKACFLRDVNIKKDSITGPNVLVMAEREKNNNDILILVFFEDAEKTAKGYSYSKILPIPVAVNLKTQKIGTL